MVGMDWAQLAELMHDQMNKLLQESIGSLRGLAPSLDHLPRALGSVESESAAAVDSAVVEFASHQQWPELTPEQKTMLYYRLEFAYMTASLLATAKTFWGQSIFPNPAKTFTDTDLIEWLLITAWREEGIKLLHSTVVDLLSEDRAPFSPVFGHN
jgi:hypothetical protein